MYPFGIELYSLLILIVLLFDYHYKYKNDFDRDSYIGIGFIFSVIVYLVFTILLNTFDLPLEIRKILIILLYIYSVVPPTILYIYAKRNYTGEIISVKAAVKNTFIFDIVYILIIVGYLFFNSENILNAYIIDNFFYSYDFILSISMFPLLYLFIRIIYSSYYKKEFVIYKIFLLTVFAFMGILLNYFFSFFVVGNIIYTLSGLLVCLNKYDKSIYRDALTGLYNRKKLDTYIDHISNTDKIIGVYVIDIDKFKHINDTYGHNSGDEMLKDVANIIKKSTRTTDISIRYGGDEFFIIAELSNKKDLNIITEKIHKNINEYNVDSKIKMSVSIGSTIWNTKKSFLDVASKADVKMYVDKHKSIEKDL